MPGVPGVIAEPLGDIGEGRNGGAAAMPSGTGAETIGTIPGGGGAGDMAPAALDMRVLTGMIPEVAGAMPVGTGTMPAGTTPPGTATIPGGACIEPGGIVGDIAPGMPGAGAATKDELSPGMEEKRTPAWGFGCAAFPLPFAGPGAATMEPPRGEPFAAPSAGMELNAAAGPTIDPPLDAAPFPVAPEAASHLDFKSIFWIFTDDMSALSFANFVVSCWFCAWAEFKPSAAGLSCAFSILRVSFCCFNTAKS